MIAVNFKCEIIIKPTKKVQWLFTQSRWLIISGYYLYTCRVRLKLSCTQVADVQWLLSIWSGCKMVRICLIQLASLSKTNLPTTKATTKPNQTVYVVNRAHCLRLLLWQPWNDFDSELFPIYGCAYPQHTTAYNVFSTPKLKLVWSPVFCEFCMKMKWLQKITLFKILMFETTHHTHQS